MNRRQVLKGLAASPVMAVTGTAMAAVTKDREVEFYFIPQYEHGVTHGYTVSDGKRTICRLATDASCPDGSLDALRAYFKKEYNIPASQGYQSRVRWGGEDEPNRIKERYKI